MLNNDENYLLIWYDCFGLDSTSGTYHTEFVHFFNEKKNVKYLFWLIH